MRKLDFLQRMMTIKQGLIIITLQTVLFSSILVNLQLHCVEALLNTFDDEMAISSILHIIELLFDTLALL